MSLKYIDITKEAFRTTLSQYAELVPPRLHELDEYRYAVVPDILDQRKVEKLGAFLDPHEVETLVEWKLKHGTFRPKLLQLVKSNSRILVAELTRAGFAADNILHGLRLLIKLKGIGPATASLILSTKRPIDVPFFSDELFRWVMWDEPGKRKGWKRGIKYDLKEYEELLKRVTELRKRLCVQAVDCEKVAWVLGRENVDLGGGEKGEEQVAEKEDAEAEVQGDDKLEKKDVETPEIEKPSKERGTKRKVEDAESRPEGSRRSARQKKDVSYNED